MNLENRNTIESKENWQLISGSNYAKGVVVARAINHYGYDDDKDVEIIQYTKIRDMR